LVKFKESLFALNQSFTRGNSEFIIWNRFSWDLWEINAYMRLTKEKKIGCQKETRYNARPRLGNARRKSNKNNDRKKRITVNSI